MGRGGTEQLSLDCPCTSADTIPRRTPGAGKGGEACTTANGEYIAQ